MGLKCGRQRFNFDVIVSLLLLSLGIIDIKVLSTLTIDCGCLSSIAFILLPKSAIWSCTVSRMPLSTGVSIPYVMIHAVVRAFQQRPIT